MGRMLGAFDTPEELDRPDLNKCPDCECYFEGDNCPLCGKECPEEMRAGNRKPPKKEKRRRSAGNGRVTFIEWYHTWWCILIATVFMTPVGLVLMLTSPRRTLWKVLFVIGVIFVVLVYPYIFLLFMQAITSASSGASILILPFLI